jgi:hypothetical protein
MQAGSGFRQAPEKTGHHRVERLVEVVVADPVLEEIAEDVQGIGLAGLRLQELEEALVRRGPIFAEVKVGDEKRA